MPSVRPAMLAVLLLACAIPSGCVRVDMAQPLKSFKDSITESGQALGSYYTTLNAFNRDIYFTQLAYSGDKLQGTDAEGKPTPLRGTNFSPEAIKARTDAITLLGIYAQRLVDLADSDAPEKALAASGEIGANLKTLAGRFADLGVAVDPAAADYAEPIGKLIGELGKLYVSERRAELLREMIVTGEPPIKRIFDALDRDFSLVINPIHLTGEKVKLGMMVASYNDRRMALSPEARLTRLAEIGAQADRYERFVAASPSNLIASIRRAHAGLVGYAGSKRTPEDWSQLIKTVNELNAETRGLVDSIKALTKVGKGD